MRLFFLILFSLYSCLFCNGQGFPPGRRITTIVKQPRIVVSGEYTPLTDSPILWIRASAITGKVENDVITYSDIIDQSGTGNNPTFSAGTWNYRATAINSQPAIQGAFDTTNYITRSNLVGGALSQPYTIWLVYRFHGLIANTYAVDGILTTNRSAVYLSGSTPWFYAGTARAIGPNSGTISTNWHSAVVMVDGANSMSSYDGNPLTLLAGSPGTAVYAAYTIGNNNTKLYTNCSWIAEYAVFPGTNVNHQSLTNYSYLLYGK